MALRAKSFRRFFREFFARMVRDPAALGLVGVNLAAGILVLLHPPYAQPLFFLYWCDCVIIGLLAAVKLFFVPVPLGPEAGEHRLAALIIRVIAKIFLAGFFLIAYGIVLLCVTALLGGIAGEEARIRPAAVLDESAFLMGMGLPVGALLAGHVFSFIRNFLGRREYRRRTTEDQLARPFGRVLPLFFILIAGGIVMTVFRFPALLVVVFVPAKIAVDLAAHFWEHHP